jgi:small-conductance mechanosensitive channel
VSDGFFEDSLAVWAVVLVVGLPALIIAAGELQERLRQRGSPLVEAVSTVRSWVLPLAALYAMVVFLFKVNTDSFGAQLIATALLVSVTVAALQAIGYLTDQARERSKTPGTRGVPALVLMLPRLLILLTAGWLLFTAVWNVDITGLFAALGVTSIVVSVALQDTLSGLASGFLLISDRPFSPGDWIEVNDVEGRVLDMNWRSSRIQDRNGDLIVIPNSVLSGATIFNFSEPARLHRVTIGLQVAYSNPPTRAKEMLLAAARATEGVLDDPAPSIKVRQIDDPLMGYEAQLWIDDYTIAPRVASDFGSLVWYLSHRMDVPLPSPAFDLYHHDPIQEAKDAELTPERLAERIRRAPLLSDLDQTDIEQLAAAARGIRFSRGETILSGDRASPDRFILWEGRARIFTNDPLGGYVDISDGDVFGVTNRAGRDEEPPRVVALTDCEVVVLNAESIGAVTSRNPQLTHDLNRVAAARHQRLATPPEIVVETVGAGTELPDAAPPAGEGESGGGESGS